MTLLPYPGDQWQIRKPAVTGGGGLVAAQHRSAAEVGAEILRRGGNAIDAAIATACAVGVVEPWMSGIGGGGILLVADPASGTTKAIDYTMTSGRGLNPADYPLAPGHDVGLFGWPLVEGDRNQSGYTSICVPGAVAGFALARERFGTRPWAELLEGAIALAEAGLTVDWPTTLSIAASASDLRRFPASAATYLTDGLPPVPPSFGPPARLSLAALTVTLRRLAVAGPRDFYEGQLARMLAADLAAGGAPVDADDLARYQALEVEPLWTSHAGWRVALTPGLTGGPTAARILARLAAEPTPPPGGAALAAAAEASLAAWEERLATMGHAGPGTCTTHLCVVDRNGMLVTLTNTLLSRFGSKVVLPETGVLMNNGVFWFDPVAGRPNSLQSSVKPLNNMGPLIAGQGDRMTLAIGASGGRSIVPAVVQIAHHVLAHGRDLETAFHSPRIDLVRGTTITVDQGLPPEDLAILQSRVTVEERAPVVHPTAYAVPTAVMLTADGAVGCADHRTPWPAVVAA
ncbi:MAG: gamma-glutamyltransferase [Alphaproteobacteria bacterium]|nr:gamma-glutamyltransferase [Alphaproteobacteria bacterium]